MDITRKFKKDGDEYFALRALWLICNEGTEYVMVHPISDKIEELGQTMTQFTLEKVLNELLYHHIVGWKFPYVFLEKDSMDRIEWLLDLDATLPPPLSDESRSRLSLLADRTIHPEL